jgi:uncharacterized LabA/DUF88 family protein
MRVGVYVDAENIRRNGGRNLRYDVLREYAARGKADVLRLNTYLAVDDERMREDTEYGQGLRDFLGAVRSSGWKAVEKPVRFYHDEEGNRISKANVDLDMSVEVLLQSENLDKIVLVTGDGDFVQVVRALQNRGCRVELVAFKNVSGMLRREVDFFLSGYLIPGLVPTGQANATWGKIGSRVRGVCHSWKEDGGYGFFRFMESVSDSLWVRDTRHSESPYISAFVHNSELPPDVQNLYLPDRWAVFEFELAEGRTGEENMAARNVEFVYRYT